MTFCHEPIATNGPSPRPDHVPSRVWRVLNAGLLALWLLAAPGGHAVAQAASEPADSGPGSAPVTTVAEPTATRKSPRLTPPGDLSDLGAWLEYKQDSHRPALADEARLFYRRGLIAQRAGDHPQAASLVRGAAELDPSFVTPHLTLAAWSLARDPSQALLRYAVALDLVRRSFLLQVELVANLVFFLLHGLFVGLLAAGLVIVSLHQAELRHMWHERLGRWLSPGSARAWAWGFLAVPFAVGFGLALPTVTFLAMLWPLLRARERALTVVLLLTLVAAPFAGHLFGRLAEPLHQDRAPLYGIANLPDEAWSRSRQRAVAELAEQNPGNPFLQFGLGWLARQGGDLALAESAYRHALTLWPQDARVMNNLANVLVLREHTDQAIELYGAAMTADPENAAAPFNLSLIYTRQFEYRAASEAAARAAALDFELVKNQQALGTDDGVLPMADQWIAPGTFWSTILGRRPVRSSEIAMPPIWNGRVETSGWWFALLALVLVVGGALLGVRWQESLPLRPCRNCGRVVCRRCSQRRRELALCPGCARQEALAESPDFARVLLARIRNRRARLHNVVGTVLAAAVPGYGLLAHHRAFRATLMLVAAALLTAPWLGVTAPFSYHSWPGLGAGAIPPAVAVAAWALIYANSLLGYLAEVARADDEVAALQEPTRSRPSASRTARAA